MNSGLVDAKEVQKTIAVLFAPGQVFEARVIINGKRQPLSGYFSDADTLVKAFDTVDLRKSNVYVTLQQVDPECYARSQHDKFMQNAKASTSDTDILFYYWLFIDLDPERKSDTSSSDEQLLEAFARAKKVAAYLENNGFEKPVKAVSGNGAHLLYRINLRNTEENVQLIKHCLEAISDLFSDDKVKIDTVNYNPSRVCKLYGTLAQKGSNTKTNPYRMSRIFDVPDQVKATPKEVLVKLAGSVMAEPEAYNQRQGHEPFELERWLSDYGIHYTKKNWRDGVTRYVLDECPFNHDHKAPDSSIFVQGNGAIGFKCLHNSCSGKTWKDVRLMFEPDAYSYADQMDNEIQRGWERHNRAKAAAEVYGSNYSIEKPDKDNPVFLTMNQILAIQEPDNEYLPTGIESIDVTMKGLQKGAVSVLSGLRGAAKSTILSQIMLNVINKGHNVICYSGELSSKNFSKWMLLQAAGIHHTEPLNKFRNSWVVDSNETRKKIADWMEGHFWLFNNNYGNKFSALAKMLQAKANEVKADFIVIDNLMALDLDDRNDKYEAQTNFVWELKNIAKVCNVHVLFVAHPRKAGGFLRLNDISGSGNIANIVDNAFIIHRNNNDFDKAITEYLGKKKNQYIPESCTNVIEICKDRENGTQDFFIPMWYEPETKRLKNRVSEYVHLGWEPDINHVDDDNDDPF